MKTRICGILTLAAGLALAGCASDNVAWHDANHMNSQNPPSGVMDNSAAMNNDSNMQNTAQLGGGNDKTAAMRSMTDKDTRFVKDAAAGNAYEINSSTKALAKSTNPTVKTFAQHMIDDHSKANDQLTSLASRKGLRELGTVNADQVSMLAKLDQLNGTDFDNEYLRQQKAAHQDAVSQFQTAAASADDRDLRDWAATTLPILRSHLNMLNNEVAPSVGSER